MEKRILIVFLSIVAVLCVILQNNYQKNLYQEIQQEMEAKNFQSAKDKLENLSNYKKRMELSYKVNLELGNQECNKKDYKTALEYYKNAKNYQNDDIINQKINNAESIIKKQNIEEEKKKAEFEKAEKLRQEKIHQAQIKENKKSLAKIEPAIKKTFYKVEILEDKSLNSGMYDFYINPYVWTDFPYDVKESTFKLAVLYAKLKTNAKYEDDDYKFGTKIRDANTRTVLAEYTVFNGIKINK